ncbi:MAG: hypothetical protein ACRD29_10130 [Acidimicrobiales bacterium]
MPPLEGRDDPNHGEPTPTRRLSRPLLVALSTVLVGLAVAGYVGDAIAPTLVDTHPLVLLLLNPRNRNLALITNQLDALSYYGVGALRLFLSDPLMYLLGYFYGDAAVRWIERKTPTYGQMLRTVERSFSRTAYPILFIAPNSYVCLFAGAAGIRLAPFFAVNLAGTITRLYLVRRVGEAFESPLDSVLDFIARYRVPLLVITVLLVVFSLWNERRQGETKVESLAHLDDELEEASREVAEHNEDESG